MMTPVLAIVKKDIKGFLTSPMFYLLMGLCCCVWSVFFAFQFFSFVSQSISLSQSVSESGLNIYHNFISSYIVLVHYVLVFILASFSLRFFAEEKKMKTFPILLSSPMTSWQIVLAKWLVGIFLIGSLLLVSSILPLSLGFFIDLPLQMMAFGYFGVFMLLCVYMSAGLFASSVADSLIVCVVLTLVLSILILLMGVGQELTEVLWLKEFFSFLSIERHFSYFRKGLFSVSSLFYIMSLSFIFSLITERVIEFHRWR